MPTNVGNPFDDFQIPYSGQAVYRTFSGTSAKDIVLGLRQALLDAGWVAGSASPGFEEQSMAAFPVSDGQTPVGGPTQIPPSDCAIPGPYFVDGLYFRFYDPYKEIPPLNCPSKIYVPEGLSPSVSSINLRDAIQGHTRFKVTEIPIPSGVFDAGSGILYIFEGQNGEPVALIGNNPGDARIEAGFSVCGLEGGAANLRPIAGFVLTGQGASRLHDGWYELADGNVPQVVKVRLTTTINQIFGNNPNTVESAMVQIFDFHTGAWRERLRHYLGPTASITQGLSALDHYDCFANKTMFVLWSDKFTYTNPTPACLMVGRVSLDARNVSSSGKPMLVVGSRTGTGTFSINWPVGPNESQIRIWPRWEAQIATGFDGDINPTGYGAGTTPNNPDQGNPDGIERSPGLAIKALRGAVMLTRSPDPGAVDLDPVFQAGYIMLAQNPEGQLNVRLVGRLPDMIVTTRAGYSKYDALSVGPSPSENTLSPRQPDSSQEQTMAFDGKTWRLVMDSKEPNPAGSDPKVWVWATLWALKP